jgi:citrate lyase gamma subunit
MEFFRSEDGYVQLSPDDALEIFLDVLKGSGDLTEDVILQLLDAYGVTDITVNGLTCDVWRLHKERRERTK